VKLWVGSIAFLLAATAITLLVFSLSRLVLRGPAALLPAIAYLVACQRSAIDGTHHWYSTLLVLIAVYVLARARSLAWIGFSGALLGLATVFTSTRGIAVAIGVSFFYIWSIRDRHKTAKMIGTLFVPLVSVVALALIHAASQVGVNRLFDSVVIFPLRYYSAGYANSFSIFYEAWQLVLPLRLNSLLGFAVWLAVSFAVPLVFIIFAFRCIRSRRSEAVTSDRNRIVALYAFAGFFALLPALGAPSAPRMNCAAAFAYIVGVAMLEELGRRTLIHFTLATVCVITVLEFTAAVIRPTSLINGSRGQFAVIDRARYEYLKYFADNARPGDRMFGDPQVNFLLGMANPSKLEWAEPESYTRPEQVADLVATLAQKPTRFTCWSEDLDRYQGESDNLQPLRAFLKDNYHLAKRFDNGMEILTLNSPGSSVQ
jgi:hypothetical protein